MAGTATMAGIGTIGTAVTGKLGQIPAAALNEQVRAASFAKALLLIRQKAAGAENIGDGLSHGHDTHPATNLRRVF
jgi:hypothetical protein